MQTVSATADLAPAPDLRFAFADLIGKPFVLGARGPDSFDCYGLVMEVLGRAGQRVPDLRSPETHERIAALLLDCSQSSDWMPCEPGPGAVVTLRAGRHVGHVGVLLPHERFIHAWESAGGICVEQFHEWRRRATGFYRLRNP
jgi:cell wall-associated NlpC family hydrolase